MSISSFAGYILTELFRKPGNWRQFNKQTSSTFSTSNDNAHLFAKWLFNYFYKNAEAATGGLLWKKLFLKISQYSQENACVGVSFQFIILRIILEHLFWKTPATAASENVHETSDYDETEKH